MKKFLFLILSLAVSASATAGIQKANNLLKGAPLPASKHVTHKAKLNAPAPIMEMIKLQKSQALASIESRNVEERVALRFGNVVTDQPEGTVKYYERTAGNSVYPTSQTSVSMGNLEGTITAVENGNIIWFKNLMYDPNGLITHDYWIKGQKAGNRVVVPLRQEIANYTDSSSLILVMGTLTYDASAGSIAWSRDEDATRAYFNIDGNKLILEGSTEFGNNEDGTAIEGYGLGLDYDDGWGWEGHCDFAVELTETGDAPVDPTAPEAPTMYTDNDIIALAQAGGTLTEYGRTGEATVVDAGGLYLDDQSGISYIYYDADGETIYMRHPVYGWGNGTWVKGTMAGNKITVPLGQYVYWGESSYYGLKTAWGSLSFPTDSTVEFNQDATVANVTYTVNEKNITMDGTSEYVGLALMMDSAYTDLGWYGCLDWNTVYWNAPDVPANVTVDPDATTAEVTWDGGDTEEWNLRYRQYNPDAEYFFCDFEDAEDLSNWGVIDADGDGNNWGDRTSETCANGTACMTSASYINNVGPLTPDNWLISPVVDLKGVVRFNAWGQDKSYASEVFAVYVTTNTSDSVTIEDFTEISGGDITALPYDSVNGGAGNTYIFDLSAYAGQQGCIAIRHYNITDMFYLNVDNFYVGDPDAPVYEWVTVNGITEIPYTIEGLTPETMYEVQVAGVNGGAVGVWTESTIFTTLAEQTVLRGDVDDNGLVNLSDVTTLINHLLSKNWTNVPGQFSYDNSDCDQNGTVNLSDVTALINYLLSKAW